MSASSAGRVLLISKGDYTSATQYNPLDYVNYKGSTYVCKQQCTNIAPTNTAYWQLLASGADMEISVVDGAINVTYYIES